MAPTLDEVLISLQKSFSRVSAKSGEVPPEKARAMIIGKVNFELTLPLIPVADTLCYQSGGNMSLKLNGVIHQDIRARHPDEDAKSPGDQPPP